MFEYGETGIGNKSIDFELHQLTNSLIKTSASEMKTLIHNFTLIVGDLVPIENDAWKYHTNVIKLIDLLLRNKFDS